MKMTMRQIGLASTTGVEAWIHQQLNSLRPKLQIDEARVRLVRSHHTSPAYEAQVHLVTPGPDVVASASDHTLRAALGKVIRQLKDKITRRAGKRVQRVKSNLLARADHGSAVRAH